MFFLPYYHAQRLLLFFLLPFAAHQYLHSFPTRRSSDLGERGGDAGELARCGCAHLLIRGPADEIERREPAIPARESRSEEHTSELQSQSNLVCRLLLEKKKGHNNFILQVGGCISDRQST